MSPSTSGMGDSPQGASVLPGATMHRSCSGREQKADSLPPWPVGISTFPSAAAWADLMPPEQTCYRAASQLVSL